MLFTRLVAKIDVVGSSIMMDFNLSLFHVPGGKWPRPPRESQLRSVIFQAADMCMRSLTFKFCFGEWVDDVWPQSCRPCRARSTPLETHCATAA